MGESYKTFAPGQARYINNLFLTTKLMTKKDYIKIAYVIKTIRQGKSKGERIAELFADMLQYDNERFDRERFLVACEKYDK